MGKGQGVNLRKKHAFSWILLIIIFLSFAVIIRPGFNSLSGFLSKSQSVRGNILIIEGWLSYDHLQGAIDEFLDGCYEYIIITGLKSTTEYYSVNSHGYLIFYPKIIYDPSEDVSDHFIAVQAASELDGENSAHFNLWVNDSLIADFSAGKRKRKYVAKWRGKLSDIDSVMVHFDNDKVGDFGDRNLFIKEIIIDTELSIPFLNNSEYDISALDGRNRIVNNMNSNAELTRKRLISMGIDSSKVIAIPGQKVDIHRTLASALAVREWLKTSPIRVNGINIVSSGAHSRRTWMTFEKVLDNDYKIGIIALPDVRNNKSEKHLMKIMREALAFIYYKLLLMLY